MPKFALALPSAGAVFAVALLIVCIALSAIIPPFQSPDEFDHVKRAYLLTKGQIVLHTPSGQSSGGMVDTGLLAHMSVYGPLPLHWDRKVRGAENQEAQAIRWSGDREFSPAPGTGYYFPLIYLPQAAGLGLGKALGRSVDTSYRLSRMFALLASAGVIVLAFTIYAPPPLAAGLLLMPMTLFQLSSATIDGICAALTLLVLSCFMRIANDKEASRPWHLHTLSVSVALLVTSRVHGLPLILLMGAACVYSKDRLRWVVVGASVVFVFSWIVIAASSTVQLGAGPAASKSSTVVRYLGDPLSFLRTVYATLRAPNYVRTYCDSFVGILGYLDASFPRRVYDGFWYLLIALLACSIAPADWRRTGPVRALLALCAVASVLLVFFAMLATWSPDSSAVIEGVQGRYFLLPATMLVYATGSPVPSARSWRYALGAALLLVMLLVSSFATSRLLLLRYYLV